MVKPIVTIGLCVKNNGETLGETSKSIADQNYDQDLIDLVIVDGGSRDKSLSIIRDEISKTRIKPRFYTENVGLGFARQMVVNNAKGKYIIWVDGDIVLSKDYVSKQVEFMEYHTEIGVAVGRFGMLPGDNWVAALENIGYVIDSNKNYGKPTTKLLGTEASIVRCDAIRKVGGFNPDIKGAQEDVFVTYKLKQDGWKFFITDALFYERQRTTLRALWKQHVWYGYGLHFVQHQNKGRNMFSDKSNDRIIFSSQAYKLTRKKIMFLLPLNFAFKKTALLFGFFKAHIQGYGHD